MLGFAQAIPAVLIAGAVFTVGIVYLIQQVDPDLVAEAMFTVAVCLLVVFFVAALVGGNCAVITPTEKFVDGGAATGADSLEQAVAALESDVCDLITRADEYIQSEVGPAGNDNPSLVAAAKESARKAVGKDIVECPPAAHGDLQNRLQRLEQTLNSFTQSPIRSAWIRSDTCASPVEKENKERVEAIKSRIAQQKGWIDAINEKVAAMQRGEISSCDKAKGEAMGTTILQKTSPAPEGK